MLKFTKVMGLTNHQDIKYRFFKVSINLIYLRVYSDTRVFAIKNNTILVIVSLWYSLVSLLFGWWSFSITQPFRSIRNTIEAIHINLTGGIDYTMEMDENNYDEKTNYIWNNLLRKTKDNINKKEVEIIIEIQEEFEIANENRYSEENINFITLNLGKVEIHRVRSLEILDVFDALQSYERNLIEENSDA